MMGSSRSCSHFVLVHGLGHGAWCWYKVTAFLQAAGHRVTALDLASAGVDKTVADTVSSVAEYLAPLTHFLAHYVVDHQVILVGHSMGGSSISYAMELFPEKISKAIFLCAAMPLSGDYFADPQGMKEMISSDILQLVNSSSQSEHNLNDPTSIHVNLTKVSNWLYNKCSAEDVSLALACLNPTPFVMTKEVLHLTPERYGSLPRFYITCLEDTAIPSSIQNLVIERNPPLKVFTIASSDHSPFFCAPHVLVDTLVTIAKT